MEFVNPIPRIGHEELANRLGVLAIEVDGVAPFVRVALADVVGGELTQVIAIWPEMVVNDIEDHAHAEGMSVIDEAAKVIRRAVEASRREHIDAVVAPTESAWKVG